MENKLTFGDAFHYLVSGAYEGIPSDGRFQLPPERLALVEADLAAGRESLVRQFMILQSKKWQDNSRRLEGHVQKNGFDFPEDDAPESHASRVRARQNKLMKDGRKNFELPLTEAIEELRRQTGMHGGLFEGPMEGDSREKPGYDRGVGGKGRG